MKRHDMHSEQSFRFAAHIVFDWQRRVNRCLSQYWVPCKELKAAHTKTFCMNSWKR